MKGLVKYAEGHGNMELRDVPEPKPGAGQVKIKIHGTGICGSDIHIYHSSIAIPMRFPVTTGHEFSGLVSEVGPGVEGINVGDRVVSETAYSFCGKCFCCRVGMYNLCNERRVLGYWYNGAFAEYTVVPQEKIHPLPDNISLTTGAMIEPLACVANAVLEETRVEVNDLVLVIGPGAIGLMAAQVAKACGAVVVISGTSIDQVRLEKAKELGIDYVVNIQEENLEELINSLSAGRGADVVFECSASVPGINSALQLARKMGQVTQIGLPGGSVNIDYAKIAYKHLKVTGTLGSIYSSWEKALNLVASEKVDLQSLLTAKLPLEEWKTAFEKFENKEGIKYMLMPDA